MKCAVLCVGKLREAYWRAAADEYIKRLGRFGSIQVIELPDLTEPRNASAADIRKLVEAEGTAMLARLRPRDHVVALCIDGRQLSSEQLAARIATLEGGGIDRQVFLIGGSSGLSAAVLSRANETLSFSKMTFPHQFARIILLEQLYRARKMLAGEVYHK